MCNKHLLLSIFQFVITARLKYNHQIPPPPTPRDRQRKKLYDLWLLLFILEFHLPSTVQWEYY